METAEKKDATKPEHMPRHLTPAENAKLTIKVLVGGALILALIWGIDAWTTG